MTKNELISQFKKQYPTLTYGVNDEVYEMSLEQYEQTLERWADFELAKVQEESDKATKKAAAEAKLAALGLTADDLKALGL